MPALLANVAEHAGRHGRRIEVFTMGHVVCRPTRREAEDYFEYFAEQMADTDGQQYYRNARGTTVPDGAARIARPLENRFTRSGAKRYDGAYPGSYPFVGSPDDVATEMAAMSATGLAGCTVAFVDYLQGDSVLRAGGAAAAGAAGGAGGGALKRPTYPVGTVTSIPSARAAVASRRSSVTNVRSSRRQMAACKASGAFNIRSNRLT